MLGRIIVTELLKLKRSKVPSLSWLAFSVLPLASGLFIWIVKDPGRADRFGLLSTKANLVGVTADWPSYFSMLNQTACMGGMVLLAVIAAYVFGREYADGTAKNMLALPIGRHWFVAAKFVVLFAWFGALVVSLFAEGLLVGTLLGLSDLSISLTAFWGGQILLSGLVGFLLVPVVTWIATLGRGYLPPIGFTIFMLVLGNVFGATGWGKWFPWSIVPMMAGLVGPRIEILQPGSLVIIGLTFAAGVAATVLQLRYADNTQ